jgi:hypothetical protein
MEGKVKKVIVIFAVLASVLLSVSLVLIIQPQPRTVKEAYWSYTMNPKLELIDNQ